MALRFAFRGTQLDAWYSTAGAQHGSFSNLGTDDVVALRANGAAGVFGGSTANMVPLSVIKGLSFLGGKNICGPGATGAFSVLARLVPRYTESPTSGGYGVIECGGLRGQNYGYGFRCYINGAGHPGVQLDDGAGNINTVTSTQVINTTSNVPFDIMFTWDGTTNAGAIKISVNGVEIDTLTAPVAHPSRDWTQLTSLFTGSLSSTAAQNMDLNELLLWDTQQAHVYTARTGFWNVAAFDGTQNTDPGQGNVVSGTSYQIAGVAKTGSYVPPASVDPGQANVLTGVGYQIAGVSKTGTFVPPVNLPSIDPGIANVLSGVNYEIEGVALQGTYTPPPATSTDPGQSNVKNGVTYTILGVAKTGTLTSTDPGVDNVRRGVPYVIEGVSKTGAQGQPTNGNGIIASLLPAMDQILGVRDTIGAVIEQVFMVTRTWYSDVARTIPSTQIGEGYAKDVEIQMLPSPGIKAYSQDIVLKSGGSIKSGDIMLKSVSKYSYAEVDLDGSSPARNVEKLYRVGGKLYEIKNVTESYVTWDVQLRELSAQTRYP